MDNFDLKKYLAENKLLEEQLPDTSLTNALKIHFQVAYEKGLEAQPEDDYNSFDEKYWKNNAFEIDNTKLLQREQDIRDNFASHVKDAVRMQQQETKTRTREELRKRAIVNFNAVDTFW